jgi:putative ABC transport system permease protein
MLLSAFLLALRAIRRNFLRSCLTTLGVIIGVGSIIALVTLGKAATAKVTSDISRLGNNMLTVMPGSARRGPVSSSAPMLTLDDARAIRNQVPSVALVAPASSQSALIVAGNRNETTVVHGSTNDWFTIRGWKIASGRLFTEGELSGGASSCILGASTRKKLFGSQDPLGTFIRVGHVSCTVIGVLEAKGASTFGTDQDALAVMPLTTFQRRVSGSSKIGEIVVSVARGRTTSSAVSHLQQLMRERRRIAPGQEDNFSIFDMQEIAKTLSSVTGVLTLLLAAIAAVSLVVGGIGIMNIMLVSVTERTREIGLRLAIGALSRDVLLQFLVEAIVLSVLGGVLGILLGLGGSWVAASALHLPYVFYPPIILIAFGFSAAIGVGFGFFPARKAARLQPIEALRHE